MTTTKTIINKVLNCPTQPWANIKEYTFNELKDNSNRDVTKTEIDNTILLVFAEYSLSNGWSFDYITDCDSQIEIKKVATSDGEMLLIQF